MKFSIGVLWGQLSSRLEFPENWYNETYKMYNFVHIFCTFHQIWIKFHRGNVDRNLSCFFFFFKFVW